MLCRTLAPVLLALAGSTLASPPDMPDPASPLAERILARAHDGDILFRGSDRSLWGRLAASLSGNGPEYGHVGWISRKNNRFSVIHADGHPLARFAVVREDPLEVFLGDVTRAALYRPQLMPEQRIEASRYAEATVRNAVPFDATFSLESDDALYCTELIWRIYTAATGHDLTPSKHRILGKVLIGFDDIQNSPFVSLVPLPE